MDKQTIIKKVNAMAWRIQSYELERLTRHSLPHDGQPLYRYPARWELEDIFKEILKFLGYEGTESYKFPDKPCIPNKIAYFDYTKDQHITDLQTRNTELVEKNRVLRSLLDDIRRLTL